MEPTAVRLALDDIASTISTANSTYDEVLTEDDATHAAWWIECAFLKLLVLAERLGLTNLYSRIDSEFSTAQGSFLSCGENEDGEPYLHWSRRLLLYCRGIEVISGAKVTETFTREIEAVLRACIYSITDKRVFPSPPANEADVHDRIEAVLRCMFSDLLRKPTLTKQIKSFEPDTGLPSKRTLIEYKFLREIAQVPQIADEILADTRGYTSRDWDRFIYVIYETRRFRSEVEWRQLLRESGIPSSTDVIVLSGEDIQDIRAHRQTKP